MWMVPEGFLAKLAQRIQSSASISSNRGATVWSSRSPASVGATLRVVTGQEPQAEPLFQSADGVAERGLRYAKLRRRPRETTLRRNRPKDQEVIQVAVLHLWPPLITPCVL